MKKYKPEDLDDYTIDGVDSKDYPDFCDAFIDWAIVGNHELTEEECEYIQDTYPEWLNEQAFESLI